MRTSPGAVSDKGREAGSGILSVVAGLGLVLLLVQGTNFYRAKESAKFLNAEKNKVLAMQMAEAGVEENIADLGKGTRVLSAGMVDVVTYDHKALGAGNYTSRISTVSIGAGTLPDIADLVSTGVMGAVSQTIQARLQLNKFTTTVPAVPPPLPTAVPLPNTTPELAACLAGPAGIAPCKICHLPATPSPAGIVALSGSKFQIGSHGAHVGDYVVPFAATTCTLYNALPPVVTNGVRVKIISWK